MAKISAFPQRNTQAYNAILGGVSSIYSEKNEGSNNISVKILTEMNGLKRESAFIKREIEQTNTILLSMLNEMRRQNDNESIREDRKNLIDSENLAEKSLGGTNNALFGKGLGGILPQPGDSFGIAPFLLAAGAAAALGEHLKTLLQSVFEPLKELPLITTAIAGSAPGLISALNSLVGGLSKVTAKVIAEVATLPLTAAAAVANVAGASRAAPASAAEAAEAGARTTAAATEAAELTAKAGAAGANKLSRLNDVIPNTAAGKATPSGMNMGGNRRFVYNRQPTSPNISRVPTTTLGAPSRLSKGLGIFKEGALKSKAAISTAIKKAVPLAVAKTVGKLLPAAGLVVGGGLALYKAINGDFIGAGLEAAAGITGALSLSGVGAVASIGLSAYSAARDVYAAVHGKYPEKDIRPDDKPGDHEARWKEVYDAVNSEITNYYKSKIGDPVKDQGQGLGVPNLDNLGESTIGDPVKDQGQGQGLGVPNLDNLGESTPYLDDYLKTIAQVESSGDPRANVEGGSAAGLHQFTENTWKDTVKQMGKNYPLEDRYDPIKSAEVAKFFTVQNKTLLERNIGRKANNTDQYMAHFLGATGASKFISSMNKDGSQSAALTMKLMGSNAADFSVNKNIFYDKTGKERSLLEVYDLMDKKMNMATDFITQYSLERQALMDTPAAPPIVNVSAPQTVNQAAPQAAPSSGGISTRQEDDTMSLILRNILG
jgi:hypothetical protein